MCLGHLVGSFTLKYITNYYLIGFFSNYLESWDDMDDVFMELAIEEAKKAEKINEVPIGAVIVYNNNVIATGYNVRETYQKTLSHAELIAIQEANEKKIGRASGREKDHK